jgi:DNA-binding transcriptional regulator LsrR (DeoR family)
MNNFENPNETEQALYAAREHYDHGRTMAAIARHLGVSRSTVSRLLSHAREVGLVQIQVLSPKLRVHDLESRIGDAFGVKTRVVALPDDAPATEAHTRTADAAAEFLGEIMAPDTLLALSWGTMVNSIRHALRSKPCTNSRIVMTDGVGQSKGGVHYSHSMLERFATAFGSDVQQFPFPIFVDSAQAKEVLEREQLLRHIRSLINNADVFLYNLGTVQEGIPSQPYVSGYFLDEQDFHELREDQAVGDLSTTFFNDAGEPTGIRMTDRTTGPDLRSVREIPRRVCVSSGAVKIPAILGALRGGLVTDLVLDEATAESLLAQ